MPNSLYGNYRTNTFTEVFSTYDSFKEAFDASVFAGVITDDSLELTYYALYARYGNSHIANSDENQFKYKLFLIIWQYAPTWEKKVEVQKAIRSLTLTELQDGSKQINDHAYNPATTPSQSNDGIIDTVDSQTNTRYKRSKAYAYALVLDLLTEDVTESYIVKFRPLFITITAPQEPLLYGGI